LSLWIRPTRFKSSSYRAHSSQRPRSQHGGSSPLGFNDAWLYLTEDEAEQLLLALNFYFEDAAPRDPGWHHHITTTGPTVTIAIEPPTL
jgi:hypothetical protein